MFLTDWPPPTWPTPEPYAGTTLNPGPGLFAILFLLVVAVVLGVVLLVSVIGLVMFLDYHIPRWFDEHH